MDAITGSAKLFKREHSIKVERDVFVPVSAGFDIAVDSFRPDSKGKFPAVVSMSPYSKEMQTDRRWPQAVGSAIVRWVTDADVKAGPTSFFVRRGYVHIIRNFRGTNKSGGTYRKGD